MGGIGDDHCVAKSTPVLSVKRLDHEYPGELPVRTRGGLEGGGMQARDLGEGPFQRPHQLERTLYLRFVLVRMKIGESGQRGNLVVDLGVVLHGARPERVEAQVYRVVEM